MGSRHPGRPYQGWPMIKLSDVKVWPHYRTRVRYRLLVLQYAKAHGPSAAGRHYGLSARGVEGLVRAYPRHRARRTPSCWRREVAFVLRRPIHRSIDGGGLSRLDVDHPRRSLMCTVALLLGRSASESGRLRHGDGAHGRGGRAAGGQALRNSGPILRFPLYSHIDFQ